MANIRKAITEKRSQGISQRAKTFGKADKTNKQRRRAAKNDLRGSD